MPTERLYSDDAALLDFEARVVSATEHEGRPAVVLDRSAFYPESGGQPWDTGRLGERAVVAVVERGHEVVHVLDAPLAAGETVRGVVDAARRRDHLQQHHGQHLLSQALVQTADAATLSFHLGSADSSVDLDREVGADALRRAEALCNAVVWEARPVAVRAVPRAEAESLGVVVGAELSERIRLVEVEGFDRQPCCGTHPRRTSEVGVVALLGAERYKRGTRVRFACGGRALDAFAARREAVVRLSGLFSAPLEELVGAAERSVSRLAQAEKELRRQREALLEVEARRLFEAAPSGATPPILVQRLDGRDAGELRALASHVVAFRPCVALLGGASGGRAHLVFAQSPGLGHDIPALLKAAVERVGGRGGGRGDLGQGGGDRVEALDAALQEAAAAVGRRPTPAP